MVIVVLDHVAQCFDPFDGTKLKSVVDSALQTQNHVTLSFSGVYDVPSSFINAALVPFVLDHGSDWLKKRLSIVGVRPQVSDMIRRCLANAERSLVAA
jgi:hypothetical protein